MRSHDDTPNHAPLVVMRQRRRILRDAGMAPDLARAIARDERYDVLEIVELLERGCPPTLAIDIVRPLDDDRTVPT